MFGLLFYVSIFIAIFLLSLGLIAILQNKNSLLHVKFLLFTLFVAAWIIVNYFSNVQTLSENVSLVLNHFVLLFSILSMFFLTLFIKKLTAVKTNRTLGRMYIVLIVFSCLIAMTPLSIESISKQESIIAIEFGPLSFVYFIALALSGVATFYLLLRGISKSKANQKNRLINIAYYLAITVLLVFITNAVIPIFSGSFNLTNSGPLFIAILALGIFYSIIKHRLFNVRLIVVRALGYILSLSVLVLAFSVFSSFLVNRVVQNSENNFIPLALNTLLFLIAILTYSPLKRRFDRLTNTLFYRDAYDAQEFLDQLNKNIVSNIEIGILLRHTTKIIEDNLKSSFIQIVVPKTENTPERVEGTKDIKYNEHEINFMRGRLLGLGKKILTIEELSTEEDELQKIMNKHDISVLAHLSATSFGQAQTIAYMIFGNKKSGNVYSKQDLKIIEIIADELVIAIQNALRFEEIQDFNITLQDKVNTATNKLRRTNEKLKAMDETKDEFISMASHQLRTPLTSVKGYLSMVLEGDAGDINDTQRKLLDQAFVSSQRMVYLIADLLNVSRLRTGKFVIDAGQANLAKMVEEEIAQLYEQAKMKNIALSYMKPADFPDLVLDETKTRQVIMNFIDNSLYYTPANGKIDVSVTEDKHHVYFIVKDNGIGVPKEEQKHLFTKFYRAKNARNLRPDGTGLGLFMAKKVITAQGGSILFESKEDKGSTFGFSFSKKYLAETTK